MLTTSKFICISIAESVIVEENTCDIQLLLCSEGRSTHQHLCVLLHCIACNSFGAWGCGPKVGSCLHPFCHHNSKCSWNSKVLVSLKISSIVKWTKFQRKKLVFQVNIVDFIPCVFCVPGHSICWSSGFSLRMSCLCTEQRQRLLAYWRLVEWTNGLWQKNLVMLWRLKQEVKHLKSLDSRLETGMNEYSCLTYLIP